MTADRSATARYAARLGVASIVAAMVLGAFATHPDYSSVSHTTSELAGQNMPGAWIMRAGFALYGLGTALAALLTLDRAPLERSAFLVFGLGFVGTALFPHVHIHPELGGDLTLDRWHSVFASAIGAAFAIACALRLFLPGGNRRDPFAWAGLIASVAIPLAMIRFPEIAGALQRAMFAVSFLVVWRRFS